MRYHTICHFLPHLDLAPARRSTRTEGEKINFVRPGEMVESLLTKRKGYSNMGIMTAAKDWKVLVDLENS